MQNRKIKMANILSSPLWCSATQPQPSNFSVPIRASSSTNNNSMETQQLKRVIVCGGGVIGVCTAFFLAKKAAADAATSVSVTLIEKSSVACAASGKAGGFLALDWCDEGPLSNLARASFNLHRSLAHDLDGARSYGYRPLHTLSISIQEAHHGGASSSNSLIPPWVDGPARNPKTIGTEETTAQVHPQQFTRTLLSTAVEKYGVQVVIGEVERVEMEEGRVKGVVLKEEGGRVFGADAVVLALGPWCGRMPLLSSLFYVSGLKAHSIVLKPREPEAITPHALFLSYLSAGGGKAMDPEVYPRPTGEVYLCGMSAEAVVPDDPEGVVPDPESIRTLHRVARTVSSKLGEEEAQVEAEQACFLPCTDDGVPVIGEMPDVKGCYVATGHSCWGILNGPSTGAAVAELVLYGHSSVVDLTPFSPSRFLGRSIRRP